MTAIIKTIDQIRGQETKVYVRWSRSFVRDQERGYSLRCGTSAEAGLSCCEIDPQWEDWRIIRQLQEYKLLCGGTCWMVTGDEIGEGSDGEPLLRNVTLIGRVATRLHSLDWRAMKLDADIADAQDRLGRITDEIARRIVQQQLEQWLHEREQHAVLDTLGVARLWAGVPYTLRERQNKLAARDRG